MTINNLLTSIQEYIWVNIVDPHLIPIYKNGEYTGLIKREWDFYILFWCLQFPIDLIYQFYWRIFIRGKCALKGCNIVYYQNWNLPDDCREWACERCWAEGINYQVNTRIKPFYDGNISNFIKALKGN